MVDSLFLGVMFTAFFIAALASFIFLVIDNNNVEKVKLGILGAAVCGYMLYVMVSYELVFVPIEKSKCEKSRTLIEEVCVRQYVPMIPEKKGVE